MTEPDTETLAPLMERDSASPQESIAFQSLHPSLRVYGDDAFSQAKVFFDIETTGLVIGYDRIIEIGAVKYDVNGHLVGTWHQYFDPEMSIPDEAAAVHGITDAVMRSMIRDGLAAPLTRRYLDAFSSFVGDATLVAHHGEVFDGPFLDHTCRTLKADPIASRAGVIDTLNIARLRWPGRKASLDEVCRRVGVDLSLRRGGHGALIDSILLAMTFPLMIQGGNDNLLSSILEVGEAPGANGRTCDRLLWTPTIGEAERHASMMRKVQKKSAKAKVA